MYVSASGCGGEVDGCLYVTNSYRCHELTCVSRTLVWMYQSVDGGWEKQMVVKVYEGCLYVTNSYKCHELIHVSRTHTCVTNSHMNVPVCGRGMGEADGCQGVWEMSVCHELIHMSRTHMCVTNSRMYVQSVDGGWEKQMVVKVYESIIRSDLSLKQTVRVTNSCHACHELISYICHELMLHVSQTHKVYESNRLQWSLAQTNDGMCHELMSYVSRTCVSRSHVIYTSRTHVICFTNSLGVWVHHSQGCLAQTDGICHELMSYVSQTHLIYMSRTHII